jgi:hypothetical protein
VERPHGLTSAIETPPSQHEWAFQRIAAYCASIPNRHQGARDSLFD